MTTEEPKEVEQRDWPRLTTNILMKAQGEIENISGGGLCVLFSESEPEPKEISLEFQLPGQEGSIQCRGEIRWTQMASDSEDSPARLRAGIMFTSIQEAQREQIKTFVEKYIEEEEG